MSVALDDLALTSDQGLHITAESYPTPPSLWAKERSIALTVHADNPASFGRLAEKVLKINREGGTLRRTFPDGDAVTFDLLTARMDDDYLEFTAKPYGRGEL